jgi:hypothetical protein
VVLKSFVLIGTILSHDSQFATVEFNLNPATNGGPSIAVLPNVSVPCKVEVGKKIYVVKDEAMKYPEIICELGDDQ